MPRNLDPLLSPDLPHAVASIGRGDEIVIDQTADNAATVSNLVCFAFYDRAAAALWLHHSEEGRGRIMRIDAQQHFWRLERGDYGWLTAESCCRLLPLFLMTSGSTQRMCSSKTSLRTNGKPCSAATQ